MNVEQMQNAMGSTTPPPTTNAGFTPQSMQQIMNTGTASPVTAAAGLGHSNSLLLNQIGGTNTPLGKTPATGPGVGAVKGVVSTLQNIGEPIAQGLNKILPGKQADPSQIGFPQQALTPQNLSEKVGYTGEKIGEFFTPAGIEKTAVAKGASYIDKLPELLGLGGKAAGAVTGALKTALHSAISGLSMGGVTAAQTGDLQKTQEAARLGVVTGGFGEALKTFGGGLAEALNKADFKLSPAAESKTTKIADNAARFITQNRIVGSSATKYSKLNLLNSQMESTLQKSLPEGIAVPKNEIIDSINTSVEQLKQTDPAIYNQAKAKAGQAINILNSSEGNIISVKDALNGKRSWASDAFKTAKKSKQDPTVSSEGAYAVEQAYQKALQGAFDRSGGEINIPSQLQRYFGNQESVSLGEFNKVYSDAINAKNLSFMSQFKNDSGLFGRLFGLWVGESIGQAISPGLGGKVLGGGVGEIASQTLASSLRNVGERTLTKPGVPEGAAKIYQATQNQPQTGE